MNLIYKYKKVIIVIAIAALALLVILNSENASIERIVSVAEVSLWITVVGFIVMYVIKGVTMVVPSSLLYIAAGLVFPTWAGILVTYIGLTISLSIGYFIGKQLGEERVADIFAKRNRIANFLNGNRKNMFLLCFMSRLFHMPFGWVSLFLGALKMPFIKYIFTSLLGVSPMMIPVMFAGAAVTTPLSTSFLIPFGISFAITSVIFIIYKRRLSKQ